MNTKESYFAQGPRLERLSYSLFKLTIFSKEHWTRSTEILSREQAKARVPDLFDAVVRMESE